MKRLISTFLIICIILSAIYTAAWAEDKPQYDFIGGNYAVALDQSKLERSDYILLKDEIMISANVFDRLGIEKISYGSDKVILTNDTASVICEENSTTVYVNQNAEQVTAAPVTKNGQMFVPAIQIVRYLGFSAEVIDDEKLVRIYKVSEIENFVNNAESIDGMYMSEELLTNTSMEDDFTLTGEWVSSSNSSTVGQSVDVVNTGKYSAKISDRVMGWSGIMQYVTEKVSVYGKGKYRVSCYIRTADEPAEMKVALVSKTSSGKKLIVQKILNVDNTKWTHFEVIDELPWDATVDNTMFLIESTSNTGKSCELQDFYIDDASLTKMMTRDEYIKYLESSINTDAVEAAARKDRYDELVKTHKDDKFISVYPKENNDTIIGNPYRGFIRYIGTTTVTDANVEGAAKDLISVLYKRIPWSDLEPEEGNYQWQLIDEPIAICKKYGLQFGTGIAATLNYMSVDQYTEQTPAWVFDAGCEYTLDGYSKDALIRVPKYDDPVFREKYQNMLDAFAERYNGNETIAYVDMRVYGNWGEWHFFGLPVNAALDSQRDAEFLYGLVDMYKNVKLPTLTLVDKPAATDYALKKYGSGVRSDGVVHPQWPSKHINMKRVAGKAMAVGELGTPYPKDHKPGGIHAAYEGTFPIQFERQVVDGQMSCCALYNWDPDTAYKYWPDMYDRLVNILGYWFKPVKLEYPQEITKGLFKLKIRNAGVAPLFAGYEKKAVVKLALADKNNNILDIVTLQGIDPLYFTGGTITNWAAEYEFKNTEGGEKLLFGIFTKDEAENPDIKLGIDADVINGWYDISTMQGSDSQNIASNKQFKASSLYADEYYGFRRPEMACDNDDATYWANKCVKGAYLEVDFDELRDISSVTIYGAESANVKYSIQVFRNNKWYTVSKASSFAASGTKLRFRKISASKLRFVMEEDKDELIKIKEIVVR